MIFEPVPLFLAAEFRVKFADLPWERKAVRRLRREVFCEEQGLFGTDDGDAIDACAIPIVAVAAVAGVPDDVVGGVRIHSPEPGLWWGSRLAVAKPYRRAGVLGQELIRVAVRSAHALGCERFLAHVQSQNAPLFHRLDWTTVAELGLHGRPHHLMQADLAAYPPLHTPYVGIAARIGTRSALASRPDAKQAA
jgi:putative N-acetyltransferase (TIGR04045 family)